MNHRRAFFQTVAGVGMAAAAPQATAQGAESDRQYWVRTLARVAEPVLTNLAAGTLKSNMPVECVTGNVADRRKVTHLEAIGRLLAGMAPWLEAPLDAGPERELQSRYAALARAGHPQRGGPGVAGLFEFPRGLPAAGGLRFSGAGVAARAQRIVEEAGSGHAEEPGGGFSFRPRDYAGTEQLAALCGHRGGCPGHDGGALRRHAHRLRRARPPAVVRGRRVVRRRAAVSLGLLQQLRHPADAAGRGAQYRRRMPRRGSRWCPIFWRAPGATPPYRSG